MTRGEQEMDNEFFSSIRFPLRPRIRITSYCNRRCQYCFAQDYLSVSREDLEIRLDVMEEILKMCKRDGIRTIAWQGGEPLLHSQLEDIIELHKKYDIKVGLFSNGLVEKDKIYALKGIVERVLINCNEPETYKAEEWKKLNDNIEIFKEVLGINNVAIGINVYKKDMDTDFILQLAKTHNTKEVRVDMTRPAPSHKNDFIEFADVKEMFRMLKSIILRLASEGIELPHFDCPFPLCALSEKDREFAYKYIYDDMKYAMCRTGLDITSENYLASCFCSVPIKEVRLEDFKSLWSAWITISYFENEIRWNRVTYDRCKTCEYHLKKICQGGCLGYKFRSDEFVDLNKYSQMLKALPEKYIERLGDAYKLFFTMHMEESWNMLIGLCDEYKYENTLWLKAIVGIYLYKEERIDFIKELIDNSSYPAVIGMDMARVLKEVGDEVCCKEILEYVFTIVDRKTIGYDKLLRGLIHIAQREKRYNDIYKYIKN